MNILLPPLSLASLFALQLAAAAGGDGKLNSIKLMMNKLLTTLPKDSRSP